jgi:hypothetical protein
MPKQTFSIFSTGEKVFIRTVTNYLVGEVVGTQEVGSQSFVVLKDASWVADMKRFYNTLKDGFPKEAEIEPAPGFVTINVGSIVDVFEWAHELPTKQQ